MEKTHADINTLGNASYTPLAGGRDAVISLIS